MAAMKHCGAIAAVLALAALSAPAHAAQLVSTQRQPTPVTKVVGLLTGLKAKVEMDGTMEQKSYDKYACWCEKTLGRKASDISKGKDDIGMLTTLVEKLEGEIGSHTGEISQLTEDIGQNVESTREATEVRQKEASGYEEEKTESEQCIGALEAAIKVLTGAGAKKGFLETIQEAQLLSVVAGVRGVLQHSATSSLVSEKDLDLVRHFTARPEEFVGGRSTGFMSATQIANNPFGDYAPQSTQIQGILKGLYDSFAASLEKASAAEADKQKSFEALVATKQQELGTLQASLETQTLDKAQKSSKNAESKELRDDTQAQLATDEDYFETTKASCKTKAGEWSERTRLRTEELQGIGKAIGILTGPEAQKTFVNSTTTLLQLSSLRRRGADSGRAKAFARLRALAKKFPSLSLAELAAQVKTGGMFDKVIASVDQMIELLRKEEADDIAHRDRCEGSTNKNENDIEDLDHAVQKSAAELSRMDTEETNLNKKIGELGTAIRDTEGDMDDITEMRNEESSEFKQALLDDTNAVELLDQTIVALSKFYKKNKIPLALAQQQPTYSVDEDKAPETTWEGGAYGGRKQESQGIIAILSMIKEDLIKEIETGRSEDAEAQQAYKKDMGALQATLTADERSKLSAEGALAELQAEAADEDAHKTQKEADLTGQEKLKASLYSDCSWVKTHFESRRDKRKSEIDGLVEAKSYLARVESGVELAP